VEGVELIVGHNDYGGGAAVGVEVALLFHVGRESVAAGPVDLPAAGEPLGEEGEGAAGLLGVGHVVGFEGADFGALDGLAAGVDLLDDEAVGEGILGPLGDVGIAWGEGEDVAGVEGEGGERGGGVSWKVQQQVHDQAQAGGDEGEEDEDFTPSGETGAGGRRRRRGRGGGRGLPGRENGFRH
jgi:hypothetical protein